jgi:energy-coupling factor transporter ATP-binding protein EcfA2
MSVLRIEGLTYRYPEATEPALRGLDLAVEPEELVVVCGLSGSGKSTLVRAACGLVPHFHGGEVAGRVVVGGLDTREHGPAALAGVCGTVLQEPETQVLMGTVRGELALPLENRGDAASAVARGVEEAALALGIAHLLDRPTHELSGGELQRVALAAALAPRPRLLVLDEPTSQLDPVVGDELIWLLRRLNEEWGTAILLAEHRLERCLAAADRVIALDHGAIACDAVPRDFLDWAASASPALQTPGAQLFARAGLRPPPAGVKEARAALRAHGLLPDARAEEAATGASATGGDAPGRADRGERVGDAAAPGDRAAAAGSWLARLRERPPAALHLQRVWFEWPRGRAALRGIDLRLAPGERVALMGRNGAGKSTLLRVAAGLLNPTRGAVTAAGRVALLLQSPGDYLIHERVADELDPAALEAAGLGALADRHPRDLSGGERQRLALAIVMGGERPPAALGLDEPTRGMDRAHRGHLASALRALAAEGTAVLVATHDPELAAAAADRVVLLGDGDVVADGPAAEVLTGGWHFATETARILGGAGQALDPPAGAELLARRLTVEATP